MLTYLINLDRSKDRLAKTGAHLNSMGVRFERLPAIDGRTFVPTLDIINPDRFRYCMGHSARLPEIGCYLSHLKALKAFLATGERFCAILEDDVVVTKDFSAALDDLAANSLYHFDLIRLQGKRTGLGFYSRAVGSRRLKIIATRVTGSTAYVVNRHCAEHLLQRLLPMVVTYDHAFDKPLSLDIRIAHLLPYPADCSGDKSTINSGSKKDKVRGIGKIPVLLWRSQTEIERAAACLISSTSEALR